MLSMYMHRKAFGTIAAIAMSLFATSALAADEPTDKGSGGVHPIAATKKAAKAVGHGAKKTTTAIGHGFRDGARAIGHGTRKVTRDVGHAFRDGAHELTGKKD
jgi:hypothetical protein